MNIVKYIRDWERFFKKIKEIIKFKIVGGGKIYRIDFYIVSVREFRKIILKNKI